MTMVEYVEKRRAEGCEMEDRSSNGLHYLFIHEPDGWISVLRKEYGGYRGIIQAKTVQYAENYIAMIEPVPVCCEMI